MKKLVASLALFSLAALLLYACDVTRAVSSAKPENNETYTVHYLFEYDGCKVYRFRDMDNYVYFINASGSIVPAPCVKTYWL